MEARNDLDPDTLSIIDSVFASALAELESRTPIRAEPEKAGIRRAVALRIMAAVRAGQRDPERLHKVALHVVEGCRITRVA